MAKKRMLLVDNHSDIRKAIRDIFHSDFSIDEASNLEDALKLFENSNYDVILTDGAYPKSRKSKIVEPDSGNMLASRIKAKLKKKILVIGITTEPKTLNNCDFVFDKTKDSMLTIKTFIKQRLGME